MDDMVDLDPELVRFLREELGHEPPTGNGGANGWEFTGAVWLWRPKTADGAAKASPVAWHFLTIDGDVAAGIRAAAPGRSAAWGSVYVKARIGTSNWETSLFPSKEVKGYLLPIKAAIRKKQGIAEGDVVTVALAL